jgi:hypothetical protein
MRGREGEGDEREGGRGRRESGGERGREMGRDERERVVVV